MRQLQQKSSAFLICWNVKEASMANYRSSLFWVQTVCFCTYIVNIVRQLFAADDFSRRHFQMHFFFLEFYVLNKG